MRNNPKTTTSNNSNNSNILNIPSSFDFDFKLGTRKDFDSQSNPNNINAYNNSFSQHQQDNKKNNHKNVFCHRSKQSKDSISEVIKDMEEGIENNLNLNLNRYIPKDLHD